MDRCRTLVNKGTWLPYSKLCPLIAVPIPSLQRFNSPFVYPVESNSSLNHLSWLFKALLRGTKLTWHKISLGCFSFPNSIKEALSTRELSLSLSLIFLKSLKSFPKHKKISHIKIMSFQNCPFNEYVKSALRSNLNELIRLS